MPILQKTFNYQGNSNDDTPTIVNLEFNFPQFTYQELVQRQNTFDRKQEGAQSSVIPHRIKSNVYHFELPEAMVIGSSPESKYGFFRYHILKLLSRDKVEDFAFQTQLSVTDDFNNSIFQTEFELIYGIKSAPLTDLKTFLKTEQKFKSTYGSLEDINVDTLQRLVNSEYKKVFVLNKKAYDQLLGTISRVLKRALNNDLYLLLLIEVLINLKGDSPQLSDITNNSTQLWIPQVILTRSGAKEEEVPRILSLIKKMFHTLIDFPILIPPAELLGIGGTLTIISDQKIKQEDLDFYNLSVEYALKNGSSKISSYNWSEQEEEINNNQIGFVFPQRDAIQAHNIANLVTVKIKGVNGAILWRQSFRPKDPKLQNLSIKVKHNPPNRFGIDDIKTSLALRRLRGKVIQFGNKYEVAGLTIVIQAKREEDTIWKIVGAATTDDSGNFSLGYPYGKYVKAQAIVASMPNHPVNLHIDLEKKGNATISDDFIYILLVDSQVEEEPKDDHEHTDDCGCDAAANKAKRLPDQADLIDSDEYTQDIGGTCLNLSTPNRSLREYSYSAIVRLSDPDVANYTLHKNEIKGRTIYQLQGGAQKISRKAVDLDNPIRWQDAPGDQKNISFYQAVTVATGHILHFKSVFKADGYSLGDLIYSLPLAPGQKKQIVVFESSHSLTGQESQRLSQGEQLSAELYSDRFITDQLSGGVNEQLRGSSRASTSGMSAGFGASASYGGFGASLGVAGGYSNSKSSASQNSGRNISQFFDEKLRQSLLQNAESYRQLNASVVTTVTEGQDYGVTSEVVANHNHCHSLTMMYFEVLRHYAIYQEVSHVEECVFVPLLMTEFTTENIHKWKDILAVNLRPIPSNTYLKRFSFLFRRNRHPLLRAFDANERIKTAYSRVDYPTGAYADDDVTRIRGRFTMNVNIARPKTKYDRIMSLPVTSKIVSRREVDGRRTADQGALMFIVGAIFGGITKYKTVEEEVFYTKKIFDAFMSLDANFESVPPAQSIRIIDFTPQTIPVVNDDGDSINVTTTGTNFFENDVISETLWKTYASILDFDNVWQLMNAYFKGRLISEWDTIFYKELLPKIFAKIVDSIVIGNLDLDFSTEAQYRGGNRRVHINFNSTGPIGKKRSLMPLYLNVLSNDPDVKKLKNHIKLNLGRVNIVYETDHFQGTLFKGYVNDDLLDGTSLYIPLSSRDKREPRKEDLYLVDKLLEHLNSHLEHYNKVLWRNLDEDRRFMLLDGFHIEIFNSFGHSAGFKSLASVVKNKLIDIAGNSLVFPVADGYQVSQSMIIETSDEDVEQEISLIDFYKPLTPIPPYRISVPTRGVFLEAIQGGCDACEMVKENSSQDWDKFRTEEPTPISTIVTPTPTVSTYTPNYKDFADPIVNIQNAPAAPAPAAGLAQLSSLLGKSDLFNDITGLDKNQQNVIDTYLSNQQNAKAFAEMSKNLAMQKHNTSNSDKLLKRLDKAKKDGAISDADYKELVKQHFAQQIDGGANEKEKKEKSSLTEAAVKAADSGKNVKASKTDNEGNKESVDISTPKETAIKAAELTAVSKMYAVELVPQSNKMSCWAASMAMLVAHAQDRSINDEMLAEETGISLDQSYGWDELTDAKEYYEFRDIPLNASGYFPSAQEWYNWLNQHNSPLFVTIKGGPTHAVVVYGIEGTLEDNNITFHTHNPWDVKTTFGDDPLVFDPENNGLSQTYTYQEFKEAFEIGALQTLHYDKWRILYLPKVVSTNSDEPLPGAPKLSSTRNLTLFLRDHYIKTSAVRNAKLSITTPTTTFEAKTNKYGNYVLRKSHLEEDGDYTISLVASTEAVDYSIDNIVKLKAHDSTIGAVTTWKFTVKDKKITFTDVNVKISKKNKKALTLSFTPVWIKSPNKGKRTKAVSYVVMHSAEEIGSAINTFTVPKEASTHFIIGRDGKLIKMVDDKEVAHHAGPSYWNGLTKINEVSIGIDLVMNSDKKSYSDAQYTTLNTLLDLLVAKYPTIDKKNIIAHSDIATSENSTVLDGRRRDPDRFFDWGKIEINGYAKLVKSSPAPDLKTIYHGIFDTFSGLELRVGDSDSKKKYGGKVRSTFTENDVIKQIQEDLKKMGYSTNTDGLYTIATGKAVRAFQLRIFTSGRKSLLPDKYEDKFKLNAITAEYIHRCLP